MSAVLKSSVSYQRERWPEFIADVYPLFEKHYEEIAWKKDKIKLAPDCERYAALDKSGALKIFTAREPELIGYATYIVGKNLHYKDTLCANNDLVYIEPSRRGRTGMRLMQYAERELKREGVQVISYHIKTWLDWGALARRMGFEHTEVNYHKWIGD